MKRRMLSILLALAICLSLLPAAFAADIQPLSQPNQGRYDYTSNPFSQTSNLYVNPSGGVTRVEKIGGTEIYYFDNGQMKSYVQPQELVIEDYSSSFQLVSKKTIPMELDLWGGLYVTDNYIFVIVGQENPGMSNSTEVIRVIKYDKSWNRLGAASLRGANTTIPFDAGAVRCDEYNGYLFVHTSHEMYNGHQANMTFSVKISDMSIVDSYYDVANNTVGYVSHSFNQFILVDSEGKVVTVDHGDGFPRGVGFMRYSADASTGKCTGTGTFATLATFAGSIGYNSTGASIGGLEETSSGYVVAYNYDGGQSSNSAPRYVYLAYISKSGQKSTPVKLSNTYGSTPLLMSTGLDGGYILWNGKSQSTLSSGSTHYVVNDTLYFAKYNADGSVGQVKTVKGYLSGCHPISYNGKFVWYNNYNNVLTFYTMDAAAGTISSVSMDSPFVAPAIPGKNTSTTPTPTPTPTSTPAPTPAPTPTPTPTPTTPTTPSTSVTNIVSHPDVTFLDEKTYITSDGTLYLDGEQISGGPYKAIAFGGDMCNYLLKEDGTLWFRNAWEEDNITTVKVLDDVVQIQPGVALKKDGTVWTASPIGTGETPKPNTMYKLMDNVKQIYSVYSCADGMALKNDGSLWIWGHNYSNSIYDGDPWLGRTAAESIDVYPPAKVMDDVAYITATMAIKTDGTLWSWGSNAYGGVGNGSEALQFTPVKVLDNVVGAWCSWDYRGQVQKYAMTKDGSVYSWGQNVLNRLGYEGGDKLYKGAFSTFSYQTTPRKSNLSGVADIFSSGYAQKPDGSVWTIGANGLDKKVVDSVKVLGADSAASPANPSSPTNPTNPANPVVPSFNFSDVKSSDYFAEPVKWAIENQITNGTSETSFSPNDTCTVAHILTFLWRSQGEPKPSGSGSFTNLNTAEYYADAALWAKEKGLVSGNTFGANAPCTRAMVVTYLWKLAGSPSAGNSGFSDVPSSAEYAKAVSWAVSQGVTNGTSPTTFSPSDTCTRGEIVTFLYRAYA